MYWMHSAVYNDSVGGGGERRDWSDCEDVQSYLKLPGLHMFENIYLHEEGSILFNS